MRASGSLLPAEGVFKSQKGLRLFVQVVFPCSPSRRRARPTHVSDFLAATPIAPPARLLTAVDLSTHSNYMLSLAPLSRNRTVCRECQSSWPIVCIFDSI